ncbi:asparagine synthase [Desulfonema ishimotonii]|uniref:asparagine synthase (glutamine-hydrolyzing) n=1 Tax=Desulfonema ishimotonii TaxID=45657 RepID=A0A401FQJ0_9BACT|nr:asparagine synthase (glutamine-hydrolyzing) [Desulfonema ishimotonii]GBC59259.1 asparagine synthase [Desulfonema ishimotonii]
MGAICGLIAEKAKEDIVRPVTEMTAAMSFRGADFTGNYAEDGIGLGAAVHQTVGDIAQPVFNETKDIIAVCDGEIYNHAALRSQLLSKGHQLPGGSDSELIPHLYEESGDDFPARLNGIFAIGLYDAKRKRFLLVRDHLGSRSVFYQANASVFLFASTIKAMSGTGMANRDISGHALDLYFAGTCVPHPHTLFANIKGVRPGHAVIWENGKVREHEYWSLSHIEEDYRTDKTQFQEQIRDLLLDAIKIRKTGDAPFASVLSGGVDSSLISAVLAKEMAEPLHTFSIGYTNQAFDDSDLQKIMINRYNFVKNTATLREEDVVDLLSNVVRHSDYPLNNASAMATYLCMQKVRQAGFGKVFEGEAADELFCGGGGVVGEHLVELLARLPSGLRRMTFGRLSDGSLNIDRTGKIAAIRRLCHRVCMPPIDRMLTWLPSLDRKSRKMLLANGWGLHVGMEDELEPGRFYMERASFREELNLYQYGACKTYLPNDLLFKNERMAAAHGLVNRTPFIDYRLAELAFKIPGKYKLTGYTVRTAEKKLIYRQAIQGLIPDAVLWHKKIRGFSQPTNIWMRNGLRDFVMDTLLGRRSRERGIFSPFFVQQIADDHMNGREDRDRLLWGILTLELWMREFAD